MRGSGHHPLAQHIQALPDAWCPCYSSLDVVEPVLEIAAVRTGQDQRGLVRMRRSLPRPQDTPLGVCIPFQSFPRKKWDARSSREGLRSMAADAGGGEVSGHLQHHIQGSGRYVSAGLRFLLLCAAVYVRARDCSTLVNGITLMSSVLTHVLIGVVPAAKIVLV